MSQQATSENISFILFIIALSIVAGSIGLLLIDYLFNFLKGWSAGIIFFIALGCASLFSIAAVPFSIASIKKGRGRKIKTKLPLYLAPLGIFYLLVMLPLFMN